MKKILLTLLFLSLPLSVSAELEVFLSKNNLPYQSDTWTSATYPDASATHISVKRFFHREALTQEFSYTDEKLQDLITLIYPELTQAEAYDRYLRLKNFSKQDFEKYIAFAIDSDADNLLTDKANFFVLTPFESIFQNCPLSLTQRRAIAKDVISRIYNGTLPDIDSIEYSNKIFGDCVIPFPDSRNAGTMIDTSFPSNQVIANILTGNPPRFGVLESEVKLFSLSQVTMSGAFENIDENNLLDISSSRVEQDQDFLKQAGKNKILFLHQNHTLNPFSSQYMSGNTNIGYKIASDSFSPSHTLFLRRDDSEEERTISTWQKGINGIYMKTVVQEDTFTQSGSVYIPNQTVDATTYYAIIYNYDTSAPICEATFFSHDSSGDENFIFPEYPWFRSTKYGYFLCADAESPCKCDSSTPHCFVRQNAQTYFLPRVFTTPGALPHNGVLNTPISNIVGMSQSCSTNQNTKVYYDRSVPEISLTLSGYTDAMLEREYVNNDGVLYDGVQVPDAKLAHIVTPLAFQADENLMMQFNLQDPYSASKSNEGVSGLSSYDFHIFKLENMLWEQKISSSSNFPIYNSGALKTQSHTHLLKGSDISGTREIFTKTGEYQVQLLVTDAAGNISRVIYYFSIIPGEIDEEKSLLTVSNRNTLYGNFQDIYSYTLSLRDKYANPLSGKQILSINHSCLGETLCKFLRSDMTTFPPSGNQALDISSISGVSDSGGKITFSVRSKSPGVFTERFVIDFQNPQETKIFLAGENTFLKPYKGVLEVFENGSWVSDFLPVGREALYRVKVENLDGHTIPWGLNDFSSSLRGKHPLTSFSPSGSLIDTTEGKNFRGTFISNLPTEESHKTLLYIGLGDISQLFFTAHIGGDNIRYFLSSGNTGDIPLTLSNSGELKNPVKVIGNLQAVGNIQNLTERQNETNIESSQVRAILRKNIGKYIKFRQHDTVVGGIKYIDKTNDTDPNYLLEENPDFETLVVRNGNILIRNDFNVSGENVGIISYIDGIYNTNTGYQDVGNIYIEPGVSSIHAFIYTDGAVLSSEFGNPLSGDITVRSPLLQKQLTLVGALFSRNTLAGGREFGGKYILPGNQETLDQELARMYDLYYLRRGNQDCIQDAYGFCNIPHYTILEYDSRVVEDPPELFSY